MCGIAGVLYSTATRRPIRARAPHDGPARAPRARRRGLSSPGRSALGHRRLSIIDLQRRRAADGQRGRHRCRSCSTARSTTTGAARRAGGARPRLPQRQRHRGHRPPLRGSRATPASSSCAACSPSRSGTRDADGCCWRATASASSRCTTAAAGALDRLRLRDQGAAGRPGARAAGRPAGCRPLPGATTTFPARTRRCQGVRKLAPGHVLRSRTAASQYARVLGSADRCAARVAVVRGGGGAGARAAGATACASTW